MASANTHPPTTTSDELLLADSARLVSKSQSVADMVEAQKERMDSALRSAFAVLDSRAVTAIRQLRTDMHSVLGGVKAERAAVVSNVALATHGLTHWRIGHWNARQALARAEVLLARASKLSDIAVSYGDEAVRQADVDARSADFRDRVVSCPGGVDARGEDEPCGTRLVIRGRRRTQCHRCLRLVPPTA